MKLRGLLLGLLACLCAMPTSADVVFPARLEVIETSPGVLEITMSLPLIGGRKPKLEPLLPPQWERIDEPEISATPSTWTTRYSVRADTREVAGEAILVQGMLGAQTDVAFTCEFLDGRRFSSVFRAARSGFLFPGPPDRLQLAAESALEGMRRLLGNLAIWAFVGGIAFAGAHRRTLLLAAALAAVGHLAGQALARQDWLGASLTTANLFAVLMALVPAAGLAGVKVRASAWLASVAAVATLIGLIHGAARPETVASDGLTHTEQFFTVVGFAAGFGLAWALASWIACDLRDLLARTSWRRVWAGTALASFAVGVGLVELGGLYVTRGVDALGFSWLAAAVYLVALTIGSPVVLGAYAVVLAGAAAIGLAGIPLPGGSAMMLGSIAFLAARSVWSGPNGSRIWVAAGGLAVMASTWLAARHATEIDARPMTVLGAELLAASVALVVGRVAASVSLPRWARAVAASLVVMAVFSRFEEYGAWFDLELAAEAALGWIRVPLLGLLLLVAAAFLWPRRSRVERELGVERKSRTSHWFALGLAVFLLPFGTVRIANPVYEPDAPRGESARRVLTSVLSDTYHAFNVEDEGELYDRLAESVSDELIDDVYLDSRRRLTAGTREGAEVAVRDVRVVEIGDPDASAGARDFTYECSWRVVARVSHLKHVHHRQNLYRGILTLRADDDRWKISGLELLSEDRSVVPWSGS
jgi:hypothetical protein